MTFCEEPRAAYDRVGLTQYFTTRDTKPLMLTSPEWYEVQSIALHVGDRAIAIDREARVVRSQQGQEIPYDAVVLATGSAPFVPPMPGVDKDAVFVYRTIEDLKAIIAYAEGVRSAAVIGGGHLGLEAAKAAYDLGLETHVIEFMPRLMPRQVDQAGSNLLIKEIESLGVRVHVDTVTKEIVGNGKVEGMASTAARRWRSGWSSSRPASVRATSWPATAASRWANAAGWSSTTTCGPVARTSSPSARWPSTPGWSTAWSRRATTWRTCWLPD